MRVCVIVMNELTQSEADIVCQYDKIDDMQNHKFYLMANKYEHVYSLLRFEEVVNNNIITLNHAYIRIIY